MLVKQWCLSFSILVIRLIELCSGQHLDVDEGEARSLVAYPYMVAVIMDQDIERRCGGVLISDQHVLTAANCADEVAVEVILGTNDLTLGGVSYQRIAIVNTDITIHPSFDRDSLANNIAVLKLPKKITPNDKIAPIKLAPKDAGQFAQEHGVLTTWLKGNKPMMSAVNLLIISNNECRRVHGRIPSAELCAKVKDDKSGLLEWISSNKFKANPGDPLVTLGDNILIGLATKAKIWGLFEPLRFTRISSYREWIDKSVGAPKATTTGSPSTTKIPTKK